MTDKLTTRPPRARVLALALALCMAGIAQEHVQAQAPATTRPPGSTPGIYTCVDSRGQRLTADRPIADCLDREQQQLGSNGLVRRVIPPSYTAQERAELETRRQQEAEQQARVAEDQRRERALLLRYPSQALHDRQRTETLAQVDAVMASLHQRQETLQAQRKGIDTELEFYKNDPAHAPAWLRRQLEDNQQLLQAQQRYLDEQVQEKRRINARFDDELNRLRRLWHNR